MADLHYRHADFSTKLPEGRLFTRSHFWMRKSRSGVWRVGFTAFAARIFGDVVDIAIDASAGARVEVGDVIGSFEGFKARIDLCSVVAGTFTRSNPALDRGLEVIDRDRYGRGWLYEARGTPDPAGCNAAAYARILDTAMDTCPCRNGEPR